MNSELIPFPRFVVEITGEAIPEDHQSIRRAMRRWHNKWSNGTVSRRFVRKIGRDLFVDTADFRAWLSEQSRPAI